METIKGSIPIKGIKRCYVEGAAIEVDCPQCGEKLRVDFSGDYLSYPEVGQEKTAWFYCETCDEAGKKKCEFEMPIKILEASIVIEFDKKLIR